MISKCECMNLISTKHPQFFTCASSSWEQFPATRPAHLRQRPAVCQGSAGRMFVKAAQFSQQSPPRVQVHHLKNMSQLFWHRAWEPKFVSDPGSLAGSVTNCCPATRMNKVIFHSLCYSKIEQELYLKQESNTLEINREKKLFCFLNHKDKRLS